MTSGWGWGQAKGFIILVTWEVYLRCLLDTDTEQVWWWKKLPLNPPGASVGGRRLIIALHSPCRQEENYWRTELWKDHFGGAGKNGLNSQILLRKPSGRLCHGSVGGLCNPGVLAQMTSHPSAISICILVPSTELPSSLWAGTALEAGTGTRSAIAISLAPTFA